MSDLKTTNTNKRREDFNVSLKDIHHRLGSQQHFPNWAAVLISKRKWIEGKDYIVKKVPSSKPVGRDFIEYYITKEMAYIEAELTKNYLIDSDYPIDTRLTHKKINSGRDYICWIKYYIKKFKWVENVDFLKVYKKSKISRTGQSRLHYYIKEQDEIKLLQRGILNE